VTRSEPAADQTTGRHRAPRPQECRSEDCDKMIVFLGSAANPGRWVAANLPGERRFVMVLADDQTRLADQDDIAAGRAVARNVLVYSSHHAPYPAVPACPGSARFRRDRST
jgi:hypothetical protein